VSLRLERISWLAESASPGDRDPSSKRAFVTCSQKRKQSMKIKTTTHPRTLARALVALSCLSLGSLAVAQTSPASKSSPTPKTSPATAATSPAAPAANAPATSPSPRTDVYHVHFVKAAAGKAVQLAEEMKKPDPKAPMPGHSLMLRHQAGDGWDYVVIEHLGTKATVEAAGNPPPAAARDLRDWHNDTFVNGPSWADFTKAMGIDDASKSYGSVYVVSVYRPIAGHDDQLEKMLSEPPARPSETSVGEVLLQHLEGGPWRFLSISRYASWADYATNESNQVTQLAKNQGGWFTLREHVSFHNDTITDRVAP
jgi:hypothetical protein